MLSIPRIYQIIDSFAYRNFFILGKIVAQARELFKI